MTNFNNNMITFNLHIEQQPRELGYEYPRLEGVYVG
jgi:hypothetical protein